MLSWRKTGKQLKKNKKNNAVRLNFFDTENYESMISEIEIFKEKHKKSQLLYLMKKIGS